VETFWFAMTKLRKRVFVSSAGTSPPAIRKSTLSKLKMSPKPRPSFADLLSQSQYYGLARTTNGGDASTASAPCKSPKIGALLQWQEVPKRLYLA
jgi:hypothetical protein